METLRDPVVELGNTARVRRDGGAETVAMDSFSIETRRLSPFCLRLDFPLVAADGWSVEVSLADDFLSVRKQRGERHR